MKWSRDTILRIGKGMQAAVWQGPDWIEHNLGPMQIARQGSAATDGLRLFQQRRDGKPKQASALVGAADQRVTDQFHQPLGACLIRGLNEHSTDRVDAESLPMFLLTLYEVEV